MKRDVATESIRYISNLNGPRLGWSELSGLKIISQDGLYFKNFSGTGKLQPYEDWRLSPEDRAKDLAPRLTVNQIAGLMMSGGFMDIVHDPSDPCAYLPWEMTEKYKLCLRELGIRQLMVGQVGTVEDMVRLNNNRQAFIESLDCPIPMRLCSDPRHGSDNRNEFNQGAGTGVSQWTETIGLAASFDPELVRKHGRIAAKEYRALGITTALSPQVDLATEPRWGRVKGTFGEGTRLATDMAKAYIDGFQTSEVSATGWASDSVECITKHFPGGGTGEAGRDAHNHQGKYAVYPGDNFEGQLIPFTEGALKLDSPTKTTSGIMPYYSIPYGQDPYGDNVANAYNRYIIKDLLREKYGYRGIICTDWEIVYLPEDRKHLNFGIFIEKRCWGVEQLTPQEQYYTLLMNTVDMFGGDNDVLTLIEGYKLGCERHGEKYMRNLIEASAVRLLTATFRLGLFENPYLDVKESQAAVNTPEFRQAGIEAQQKSVVMLKNHGSVLPLKKGTKLFIPERTVDEAPMFMQQPKAPEAPVSEVANGRFVVVDKASEADAAVVFINSPEAFFGGPAEKGYNPISLQYRPYTAVNARAVSIAGDDPNGTGPNRSYKGKTARCGNEADLDLVLNTVDSMKGKPVIVVVKTSNPFVVSEFEPLVDGLLVHFDAKLPALFSILDGSFEPSGLLPMQFPANMDTVEAQCEDLPFDMKCHVDSDGHVYDYAYGMNWSGIINDERVCTYGRAAYGA